MQPYKKLFTYWFSVLIYDLTVEFCDKFILRNLGDLSNFGAQKAYARRQTDQMVGATRSGKQNIVEGSDSMATSIKSAIKLTGVAKASIEELIGDLEDFLRQRRLARWSKDDQRVKRFRAQSARIVRSLSDLSNLREPSKRSAQERKLLGELALPQQPEAAANLLLTLCHQATYLLHKQVESLKRKHQTEGGLTEKLYANRTAFRSRNARKNPK